MLLKTFAVVFEALVQFLIRYVIEQLEVQPTGVSVDSRWRDAGDISESRAARYAEAQGLGLPSYDRRGRSQPPWRRPR